MGIGSDATNACAGAEFVDGDEQVWASQMFVNTWQPEWIFSILELRGFFPRFPFDTSELSCPLHWYCIAGWLRADRLLCSTTAQRNAR